MSATAVKSSENEDFERADRLRIGTTLFEMIRRLWPYLMQRKLMFFGTVGAVIWVNAAARLAIFAFAWAIDYGILKKDTDMILMMTVAYFFLEGTGCVMEFAQSYLFAKLGNFVLYQLRQDLLRHTQGLPVSYFDRNPSGRIVTRLTNDVVSLGEVFTQGLINVFSAFIAMGSIILAMLFISWRMTIAVLVVAPVLLWIVSILTKKLLLAMRASKAKLASINAFVAENIGGMRVLQLYGRVGKNQLKFQKLSGEYRENMMQTVKLYALLWPVTNFFTATSVAITLYFGGKLTIEGAVTAGSMVAFILNVRAFIDPLQTMIDKYQVFQNSLSSAERIFTIMDEIPEENAALKLDPKKRLQGEIEFKAVSFAYGEHLAPALKEIDLHIKPGQSIAIVGRTGSGKSTTISLLQRLYEVTSGRIFIDQQPIEDFGRRELRSRIGVVQQDTFMFRGTIAHNISLGDPKIIESKVLEAAKGACLDEFLSRSPLGLEGKVEERGANLSFGERQLIAFARILAFDPDILILDEATANIDSHTEDLIQVATRRVRQGRTSVIIAHRISTIMDCDKIIVLDHGTIAEIGTHRELYNQAGIYRGLCDAQFKTQSPTSTEISV